MSDRSRYMTALFNPGETVCLGKFNRATKVYELSYAMESGWPAFVSANPIKDARLDANVTAHRNLVIEFDQGTLKEQAEIIASRGLPYTTLTFSGGKSLHAVVALQDSLPDEAAYRKLFRTINDILWMIDNSCINPSRLTRIGGATHPEKRVEQKLIDVRRRISLDELHSWISRFEKHLAKVAAKRAQAQAQKLERVQWIQQQGIVGIEALEETDRKFLEGEWNGQGSRHRRLVGITYRCLEHGVPYEEALARIFQAHDLLGIPERAHEAQGIVDYVYI
jgi:hypothetical protein